MMPNGNDLALTLTSEMGKNPAKNSKKSSVKSDGFLKAFGKNQKDQKDEKEKNSKKSLGFMIQPFAIGQFSAQKIVDGKKIEGDKITSLKNQSPKENFNLIPNKNTANKTVEVLGNRIESTKSNNLKLEKKLGIKENSLEENVLPNIREVKKPNSVQSLKLEEVKGKTLENSTVGIPRANEVQNKGRVTGNFTKSNPLISNELQAKDNSNFAKSDLRKLEPAQEMISGYGLKKINNQINLEEKVEKTKELIPIQKEFSKEKVEEKVEISPINQWNNEINFEPKEIQVQNKMPQKVDYSNLLQQVENGIKINYNNQLKEMKIKLQPEELGEVEVKMTIENNIMKAEFVVESQIVKEILESKFDTLRNALENKGFTGAEINVSVSTGENKKQQSFFVLDEERKREIKESVDFISKIENLDSNSKITKISNSSSIDIMV